MKHSLILLGLIFLAAFSGGSVAQAQEILTLEEAVKIALENNYDIKLAANNIPGTLDQLGQKWKQFSFERPFEYFFLDESFAKLHASEASFQKVFIGLVILGIFIACLGLLGLATYAAQQRVKEIGIRKTLGASVINVVILLSSDFIKLVIIALLIACTQWA